MSRWIRPAGAARVLGAAGVGRPPGRVFLNYRPSGEGPGLSRWAESLMRAEAVRPFPVEVKPAQVADGDRDMEVSELPCSTGEHTNSVEPVREIAMAESLVVTRPRRVKDGVTGIRFLSLIHI